MKRANCEKHHSCPRQCPFPVLSQTSGDKCPWSFGFVGCCVTRGSRSAPTRLCQGPANIKWWGIKTKILWKRKIFFRFFQFFGSFGPRHVNSMTNCSLHLRFFNGGSVFSVYNNIVNSNLNLNLNRQKLLKAKWLLAEIFPTASYYQVWSLPRMFCLSIHNICKCFALNNFEYLWLKLLLPSVYLL